MATINLKKESIDILNRIMEPNFLENNIDLLEELIDDCLGDIPASDKELRQILDRVACLRSLSKDFSALLKSVNHDNE